MADRDTSSAEEGAPHVASRRRFLGYLLAAPTLVAAAEVGGGIVAPERATAAVPSPPQPSDLVDLNDILTDATLPTANLISVTINKDGTASFVMPRAETGKGITT
jgi:isoquinoline 1-oxidoreductase beta subunit